MAKRLFKKSKSGMGYWEISTSESDEGYGIILITYAKKEDGKPTIQKKIIKKGKNIGKANETTPLQQAQSEAASKISKQLDGGYKRTVEEVGEFHTNQLSQPLPMLAKRIEKVKNIDCSKFAVVQSKLDGHRCQTVRTLDGILQYSKEGKIINTMTHMYEELMDILEVGDYLDGELYNHELTLQQISSLVKKKQPDSELIQYHVYDSFSLSESYQKRFIDRFHTNDQTGILVPIEMHSVDSVEEAWEWFTKFVAKGYEGAMLRVGEAGYEVGERSSHLLKLKAEEDAEFTVLDISEGEPQIRIDGITGEQTSCRVGILHLKTDDGKPFTVTAPGKFRAKEHVAMNPKLYIGKEITVKYPNLTPDGIPFHAIAHRFKDYV